MLLNLAKKLRADATKAAGPDTFTAGAPVGSLTLIELYQQPRYGEVDGIGPVRIEGEGNMVGFSPVTKCVDEHGETAWIPTELVRNIRLEPFGFTTTKGRTARK
jgi:hypothetical protein